MTGGRINKEESIKRIPAIGLPTILAAPHIKMTTPKIHAKELLKVNTFFSKRFSTFSILL